MFGNLDAHCMYVVFSANQESAENMEELDDDIAVTQSQVNFTCPLTQVDHSSLLMGYFTLQQFMLSHWILFLIFLHLYIISDNNILDSLSAKHGKPPWFDVLSAKLCFWSLFPYITHHCVFVFKVEMVNPVKNKKCNHHYDEGAILGLIKTRQSQKKKCR